MQSPEDASKDALYLTNAESGVHVTTIDGTLYEMGKIMLKPLNLSSLDGVLVKVRQTSQH